MASRSEYSPYVYVMHWPDAGWVKIGIARRPEKRLNPFRLSRALGRNVVLHRKWKRKSDSYLVEQLAVRNIHPKPPYREDFAGTPEQAVAAVEAAIRTSRAIMKRIAKNERVRDLAKEYGVAPGTIYNAIRGTISALKGKPKREPK
jgi:hypothetical protein